MSGVLYLCPTPIGNLGDITFRTLEILKSVELIAAEDTRNTLKLLNHFEINVPLTSYYEHNKAQKGGIILEKLKSGQSVALVSDAGMPAISDPGEDLVRLCISQGIQVIPLPGASAFTTALVASGMPTGRFSFEGFLTTNKRNRKIHLEEVRNDTRTLIFYEAPHKLLSTLQDMLEFFGDREIVLARELTKKFEEFFRTTIAGAIDHYKEIPPKGEFVLIIKGKNQEEILEENKNAQPLPEELLKEYAEKGLWGKELVGKVSDELGLPKREVYDLHLRLKEQLEQGKRENKI